MNYVLLAADCEYHPGEPVFHDAEKVWSCCNKRSKDFTVFLGMPGCETGPHNSSKPVAPTKPVVTADTPAPVKPVAPKDRPSYDAEMICLEPVITNSLKQVIVNTTINFIFKLHFFLVHIRNFDMIVQYCIYHASICSAD